MGHPLVTATRTMNMRLRMRTAIVLWCAAAGVCPIDLQHVVIDMIAVNVVQVAIVQVVGVAVVCDGNVTATWTVLMIVAFMHLAVFALHWRARVLGTRFACFDLFRHFSRTDSINHPTFQLESGIRS